MHAATLSSHGRITLPKAVREALGAKSGDKIRFVPAWNGFDLVVVKQAADNACVLIEHPHRKPATAAPMDQTLSPNGGGTNSRARHKR